MKKNEKANGGGRMANGLAFGELGANCDDGMVPCPTCNPKGERVVAYEDVCGHCYFGHVLAQPALSPPSITLEQMNTAARNVGADLDCGACAALFFTGYGGYEHAESCKVKPSAKPEPPVVVATCWCGWKPPKDLKIEVLGVVSKITFRCPECDRLLEKILKEES